MHDMNYPAMLYRAPGPHQFDGYAPGFAWVIVNSEAEQQAHEADGWHASPDLAKAAHKAAIAEAEAVDLGEAAADETATRAEPTRAELEQKADELGIKYDGRVSDRTIAKRIGEALKV
jgi:hypothetical protein